MASEQTNSAFHIYKMIRSCSAEALSLAQVQVSDGCTRAQALREHLNAHNDDLTGLVKCLTEHGSLGIKRDATLHGQHSKQAPGSELS